MDKTSEKNVENGGNQEPPKLYRRIGNTNYEISMYFSQTSNETMADKIKRLIQNDMAVSGL